MTRCLGRKQSGSAQRAAALDCHAQYSREGSTPSTEGTQGCVIARLAVGSGTLVRWSSPLYWDGRIKSFANGSADTCQLRGVDADLRVQPFFAQGGTISIREFVVGAFTAEMGVEGDDPVLAAAVARGRVVTPSGMVLNGRSIAARRRPQCSITWSSICSTTSSRPCIGRRLKPVMATACLAKSAARTATRRRCASSTIGASPTSRRASIQVAVSSTTCSPPRRCVCPKSQMS